ncbi:MAG: hypothetical protein AAF709_12255, partial [Pseudomonadota bacterium]
GVVGAYSASWQAARDMAAATHSDPTAIWEWAVVERVSTGLVCFQIGVQPVGTDMLSAAEVIVAGSPHDVAIK